MPKRSEIRERWRIIIFEAETPAGKRFDLLVLLLIVISVLAVMLESVASIRARIGFELFVLEWILTGLFTLEYAARLWTSHHAGRYAKSFYGVVDLISILPSYIALLLPGGRVLMVIRVLRLLRMFRVLKMYRHIDGADLLLRAMYASRAKITVFFVALMTITLIAGTLMYMIEGDQGGHSSIPISVYWAIVTITTLGYGDITPMTPGGQILTSILSLAGYAIIAVPTGIFIGEITRAGSSRSSVACPSCGIQGHLPDAKFCRRCGEQLP